MNFTANVFHFFYIFPLTYASCRKIPGRRMNGHDYSQFHGKGGRYWEYFDNVRVRGAEQMPRCATRFLNTKRAYSRSPDLLRRAGLQDKEAIIRGMGMFRPILRKFHRIRSDRLVVEVSPPIPFFFSLSVPRLTHEWKGNAT